MFLISLDTSAVFMWCCIIRGSASFRNNAGFPLVNGLHSVKRCWAVCSVFSGQLHSGMYAFPFYRFMSGTVLVCQELCKDVVWTEGLGHSEGCWWDECFGVAAFLGIVVCRVPEFYRVFFQLPLASWHWYCVVGGGRFVARYCFS